MLVVADSVRLVRDRPRPVLVPKTARDGCLGGQGDTRMSHLYPVFLSTT